MAGLYEELKRRNVFRVAIAYVIVAWLVLQIGDTLAPALLLPAWANTLVAFFLILGFPIAMFFAWAFEVTPEGIKKEQDVDRDHSITQLTGRKLDFVIITVLVVALGYFALDKYVLVESQPEKDTAPAVTVDASSISIAVLPFVNMSDDPGNEYFADGLSEEILNLLAGIPDLKVIGRTSSFSFKGKNDDLRVIGQTLGVNKILEGAVRKSGEQVRITAQLIEVSDGSHIWSDTFDRTLTDIFVIQDDVAAAIIGALQIHVSSNPVRGSPTKNLDAYGLFLKARVLLDAQKGQEAIELLLQATELDPNFGEAVELLAFGYWQQGGSSIPMQEAQRLCHEAAARALAIDSNLTFAHALYQLSSTDNRDVSVLSGIESLKQALRDQPSNSALLRTLFFDLTTYGYLQEAHRFARQFVEREPLSTVANYSLGESLVSLGRTSEAIAPLRLAFELDNAFAQWFLPVFDLFTGRDESAIAIYESELKSAGISDTNWVRDLITDARNPLMGAAYLKRRIPHILDSMPEEQVRAWQFTFHVWYLVFGFLELYYDEIIALGPDNQIWTDADMYFWLGTIFRGGGFTAHPMYLEVAELLDVTDVWEVRGPPDFCDKTNGKWVCE